MTLIEVGAKYTPLLLDGEWWRLVTTMFIHIGFLHLMMNSLALYFLGTLVERMYGSLRFFGIYVVAGITGSIVSIWTNLSIGAGASGAIFGLFGALLYFGLNDEWDDPDFNLLRLTCHIATMVCAKWNPERIELKKYSPRLKRHTLHRETK